MKTTARNRRSSNSWRYGDHMIAKNDLEQVIQLLELAVEWLDRRSSSTDRDLDTLRTGLSETLREARRLNLGNVTPS